MKTLVLKVTMKNLILAVAVTIFFAVFPAAKNSLAFTHHVGQFRFTDSKETTAEDIDLDFTPEKAEWVYGKVRVLGHVKNKTNRSYRFVKVTFSAWGTGPGWEEHTHTPNRAISVRER